MLPKCWLLRKFLWPIAHTARKTRYFMKLNLLNSFWDHVLIISQECTKIPCWAGLFRKSAAFAWHNQKLTTLERFLPALFISSLLDCICLWNGKVCDQTCADPLADGRCREGGKEGKVPELPCGTSTPILTESGHLYEGSLPLFSPRLEEIYPKAVASSSGFFGGGEGRGVDLY